MNKDFERAEFKRIFKEMKIHDKQSDKTLYPLRIETDKDEFGNVRTTVYWEDLTKTIVLMSKGDTNDVYMAFCAALAKRLYGTNSRVHKFVELADADRMDAEFEEFLTQKEMEEKAEKEHLEHLRLRKMRRKKRKELAEKNKEKEKKSSDTLVMLDEVVDLLDKLINILDD